MKDSKKYPEIRITKAQLKTYWYNDYIDSIFRVISSDPDKDGDYILADEQEIKAPKLMTYVGLLAVDSRDAELINVEIEQDSDLTNDKRITFI